MKSSPLVSVIIPIYNVEPYFKRCIDSAVNQTLKDIEIICVDDGSPDRCGEIAEEYAQRYDNIRVIHQENGGVSVARNTGLDAATGKYVYFMDSDDYLELNALEELYAKAEELQVEILHFNLNVISENVTKDLPYMKALLREQSYGEGIFTGPQFYLRLKGTKEWICNVWASLFLRQFLVSHEIRFYPGIIYEDHLFSFLCTMQATRVAHIAKKYYNYVRHQDSIVHSVQTLKAAESRAVSCVEILKYLQNNDLAPDALEVARINFEIRWRQGCNAYRALELPSL